MLSNQKQNNLLKFYFLILIFKNPMEKKKQ